MTILAAHPDATPETSILRGRRTMVLLGIVVALQLATALFREVNWDEFYFLSLVFEYERQALTHAMQTFHVHLFSWLVALPTDDLGRIIVARCLMWLMYLATLWFLFQVARSLVSAGGAIWTTFLYATLSFVAEHATSFRADPIITVLLMGALFGLTRERLSLATLIVAALAVALAGLVSIKSVFYVPIIAMVAILRLARSNEKGRLFRDMAVALAAAAIAVAALYAWHAALLGETGPSATNSLADAYAKQLGENELFRGAIYLFYAVIRNPVQWLLIVAGLGLVAVRIWKNTGVERLHALTVLSFASPLLLIAFYRNTFPYFYVFMMAPVALIVAPAADALAGWSKVSRIVPLMVVLAVTQAVVQLRRDNSDQRSLISAVHEIFPEPVPYIDGASTIASYPNAAFFMSTWGIERYRRRGEPVLLRAIDDKKPLFVVVSNPSLAAALEPGAQPIRPEYQLLPADAAALRENYVRHWGPLWIAGKRLATSSATGTGFAIAIPGTYTLDAGASVEIDGRSIAPGEVVALAVGSHTHKGGGAVLRFGNNTPVPARTPPQTVFTGF